MAIIDEAATGFVKWVGASSAVVFVLKVFGVSYFAATPYWLVLLAPVAAFLAALVFCAAIGALVGLYERLFN